MDLIVTKLVLLLAISSGLGHTTYAEDHHWPNFSCYTANQSALQKNAFYYNKMGWRSCLERDEKYKGNCANICMFLSDDILYGKTAEGPVVFDVDAVIKYFARELGYAMKGSDKQQQELMAKIRKDLEACKKTHPEHERMTNLLKTPCKPWKPFLECFDMAIGCGKWGMG